MNILFTIYEKSNITNILLFPLTGQTTEAIQELMKSLKSLKFLSTSWLLFNAFIFGLLKWVDGRLSLAYCVNSFIVIGTDVYIRNVYVCRYVSTYLCIYGMYFCINNYVRMCIGMCECMHVCNVMYICIFVWVCMYLCMYVCMCHSLGIVCKICQEQSLILIFMFYEYILQQSDWLLWSLLTYLILPQYSNSLCRAHWIHKLLWYIFRDNKFAIKKKTCLSDV